MYRLFYDGEVLHDPRDDKRRVTECKVELESNTAGTLTFKIAPAHPLFGKLRAMDTGHEVIVMDDTVEVFRGRIKSDGKDMQTVTNVTCEGQLAYLNDSVVRAYGTYASDDENWTVVKGDNIFRWYVSQHNGQSDANKQFVIGKCETGYGLTRSSTQHPTTGQEIKEKLLDALSCYIDCYMDNGERILDLLEFGGADAEQSIEFGTNLLDYATTRDASSIITDIIPTGTDNDNNAIDITSLRDGDYGSCYKEGDHVSFSAGVNLYGHITEARSYDGTTPSGLLNASINDLQTSSEVIESVNIKAVDLHNVDPTVKPIRLNEWVLVSSKPHGVYQSMMCVKMTIDINDPTQTVYTFGATLPSLTSGNAMKVAQNRQRQEEMIVAAAAISVDAKAAAELATTAQMAANTAQTAANTAQSTANTAKTTADAAQGTANTAQSTADTANSNAGKAQDTANAANSTADTANSTANTAVANASKAQSTADKAQATADSIEVGGRNYYKKTTKIDHYTVPSSSSSDGFALNHPECDNGFFLIGAETNAGNNHRFGGVITSNGHWTVSWEMKGSQSVAVGFEMDVCDTGSKTFLTNTSNTWEKRSLTVDVTNYGDGAIYNFVDISKVNYAYVYVRNFKVEKGNRATDWTPAPEDVDANITAVDSKVTTISTRTSTLENTTTGMKSDVSALQTTIKTKADNSTVTSVDNKVSTLTNTVNGLSSTVSSVSSVANSAANSANNAQITADSATTKANTAQATADKKADQTDLDGLTTTVTKNYSDLSNTIDGFKTTVSSTYATQTTVNSVKNTADTTNKNVTAITTRTATLETNVNAITGRVTATETVANTAKTNAATAQTAANNAQSTANTANTNAGKAQSTADTANATANTATSNITGLTTRVTSAESKLTATALTTTISSGIAGSNAIDTTKFTMDKNGLTIKNGGLIVQNATANTVATIGPNGVLQTGLITAANITAGTITGGQIAAGTISANNLASNSITADKVVSGAVTTEKLAAKAVTANNMAANSITADKIAAGAITADKFYGTAIASTNYAPEGAGMKIDLVSGTIDTKNFKVDSAGNTTIKNGGITVKNNDGTEVFSTDANGDLEITGTLRMSGSQSVRVDNAAGALVGKLLFEPISGVTWSPGALKVRGYDYLTLEAGTDTSITKAYGRIMARGFGLAMLGSEDYGSSGNQSFFGFGQNGTLLGVKVVSTSNSYSETMTFRTKQFPQIIFGSMVYAVANDSAIAMFDDNALDSMLGGADGVNNLNTVVVIGNGDGAVCNVHCQDCTYLNGTWYATFDRIFTGNVRVNYAVLTYA